MNSSSIGQALFTKAQQSLLALFFSNPEQSYYLNEVIRHAAMGSGAVTRELEKLASVGILTITKIGNQKHFQANKNCPIYPELTQIVLKTFGIKGALQDVLKDVLDNVEKAFIYGSIASGLEHGGSDIDLMLVGEEISYTGLMETLEPLEAKLHRPINPTIFTPEEFSLRLEEEQSFLKKVMSQPQIDLK